MSESEIKARKKKKKADPHPLSQWLLVLTKHLREVKSRNQESPLTHTQTYLQFSQIFAFVLIDNKLPFIVLPDNWKIALQKYHPDLGSAEVSMVNHTTFSKNR